MQTMTRELEGSSTDIAIQYYADRILILITQVGKIGNLIQASLPSTSQLPATLQPHDLPEPSSAIQLTPLFGSAPSEEIRVLHSLYASQIATLVWTLSQQDIPDRRSVIVGIALKKTESEESTRKVFLGVVSVVKDLLKQNPSIIAQT